MKKILMVILTLALGFGLAIGDLSWVCAQEEEFTLEEITVTAQKREENQQKVGIQMSAVSGDELKEMGQTDVDAMLRTLSNVMVRRSSEGLMVGMRGINFVSGGGGYMEGGNRVTATVGINLDGVTTLSRPTGSGLYDIDRIEVLYGPQSTMYAQNSPAGIMNINFARPKLDDYAFAGTLEYGNYNLMHWDGMVNAPVSETLALRAAANFQVHKGYISNGGDDDDSKSGRLRLLWKPSDRFSILLTAQYDTMIGRGITSVPPFGTPDEKADPWYNPAKITGLPREQKKNQYYAFIDLDLGFSLMTLIPAKTTNIYYRTQDDVQPDKTTRQLVAEGDDYENAFEIRLSSPADSRIKWVGSFNYYKGENLRDMHQYYASGAMVYYIYHQLMSQKAILGQATIPITDRFRGIAGLRYSKDRALSELNYIYGGTAAMVNTRADMRRAAPSYKIGIEYDLSGSSMIYASHATGYRVESEAMNWKMEAHPPQKLVSFEIGSKNRFFGNKLQLNAAVYHYLYYNLMHNNRQDAYVTPVGRISIPDWSTAGGVFTSDQGGRTPGDLRTYGVDVQTSWIISASDKLDLTVSYLDNWITKLIVDYEFKDQPYSSNYDFSNREPLDSPKWTVGLDYRHNFILPNDSTITFRVDTKYQSSSKKAWLEYNPRTKKNISSLITQEAYHIDNATLVYANSDGQWTLSTYVKNIWNYAEKRTASEQSATLGTPRTYGFILSVKY